MTAIDASVPVVVLTASPQALLHSPLAIARSLGRLGVPVYAAHPGPRLPYDSSRHLAGSFAVTHDPADADRLTRGLERVAGRIAEGALLIPVDDTTALHVDEHADTLARWFRFPRRPGGLAASLASKRELHRICERHGVPTAHTVFPTCRQDVVDHARTATFPVVAKVIDPDRRPDGVPSVTLAASVAELLAVFDRACGDGAAPNLMLQEYLPGGAESIWMFNGYFDARSRCLVAFTGTKLRQCPPDTGPTSLGVCRDNRRVKDMTVELLARLGYTGVVDLGYRFDPRDGRYKLLDVNPRVGGTFRLFVDESGTDVVRALYLDLTGQPVPSARCREGRRWLDEPHDAYASLRYVRAGRLSPTEWLGSLRPVRETAWFAADDPAPFLAMLRSAARAAPPAAGRRRSRHAARVGATTPTFGPDEEAIGRYFDTHADFWREVYRRESVFSIIHRQREELALAWVEELGLPPGSHALDAGCGAGRVTAELARRGYRVTAVDAAGSMVEATRRRVAEAGLMSSARIQQADVHGLPFADGSFDLVVALGVLPWVHSPAVALKEMTRVLRPGGHVVVNTDNSARITARLDPARSPALRPARHAARSALTRLGVAATRPQDGVRATMQRLCEADRVIADAGLERVAGTTLGFGPFTLLGREVLPPRLGAHLHASLQRMADRGVPGVRSSGTLAAALPSQAATPPPQAAATDVGHGTHVAGIMRRSATTASV